MSRIGRRLSLLGVINTRNPENQVELLERNRPDRVEASKPLFQPIQFFEIDALVVQNALSRPDAQTYQVVGEALDSSDVREVKMVQAEPVKNTSQPGRYGESGSTDS